jgi:methyl-accepting chemotaxis protein
VGDLLSNLGRLSNHKATRVANARASLEAEASRRSSVLLGIIAFALMIGVAVVVLTVRRIAEPLDVLVRHAQRLSEGDLASRAESGMPGEFSILANAMNQTGESLVARGLRRRADGGRRLQLGA